MVGRLDALKIGVELQCNWNPQTCLDHAEVLKRQDIICWIKEYLNKKGT